MQEARFPIYVSAIPLHPTRYRWRGFNQSEIIGTAIAHTLSIPFIPLLKKTKITKMQAKLGKQDRLTNIRDCFAIQEEYMPNTGTIILIDDVTTTGSTLLNAAQIIKQKNTQVTVWCVAAAKD